MSRKGKSVETESRLVVAWSWGWEQRLTENEHKRSLLGWWKCSTTELW